MQSYMCASWVHEKYNVGPADGSSCSLEGCVDPIMAVVMLQHEGGCG
jgi:hypothetical protein